MHIFSILTGLWLSAVTPAPFCSCGDSPPFLTVAPKTPLVALVKVNKHLSFKDIYTEKTPMSMEVEIIDMYRGTETHKTLTVWGDNGILCRPYLSAFKKGEYYVIAFSTGNPGRGHTDEKTTDYAINGCGTYWLTTEMTTKIAKGDINGKERSMGLDTIKNMLAGETVSQPETP